LVPGRVLEVSGTLAAPYGNLELRPVNGGVRLVGNEPVPQPRSMTVAEFGEGTEGLLGRVAVTVRRIDASSTSLTLIVEDESGEGRVFIHRPVGLERSHFSVGGRIEVTGIVGDRSGLYRLWPRDPSDVRRLSGPAASPTPGPTPAPTSPAGGGGGGGDGTGSSGSSDSKPISIAAALRRDGQTMTIEGSVTVPPGLLDADGRRLILEDSSAAVMVRLPAGTPAPSIGHRLRVTGQMGTYYGAPQLAVSDAPIRVGSATVAASVISRAPIPAALEWRLVTVTGDVVSVHRDGQAWRAELSLAGGPVPIMGVVRAGIPADALLAGRRATIRGLVKRAHPTARDQRYAILPRSPADIALGGSTGSGPDATSGPGGATSTAALPGTASSPAPGGAPGQGSAAGVEPDVAPAAIGDLAAHAGRTVRIGGRIESIQGPRFVLRDDSASVTVRLAGAALPAASSLRVAAIVNATGEVRRADAGGVEVVVSDPAHIRLLSALVVSTPTPPPARPPEAPNAVPSGADLPGPVAATSDGLLIAALLAVAAAALGVEFGRRVHRIVGDRRSAARIAERLSEMPPP
jgi:hypothetical protein